MINFIKKDFTVQKIFDGETQISQKFFKLVTDIFHDENLMGDRRRDH